MATKRVFAAAKIFLPTAVSLALSTVGCQPTSGGVAPGSERASAPESVPALLRELPARFETLHGPGELERWASQAERVPGVTRVERMGATSARVVFAPPLPARKVARWLGLGRAFVVSDGQAGWHLVGNLRRAPGGRGLHHVQSSVPVFGRWQVDARVAGRPEGPLPNALANGSPAYPLRDYDAQVTSINIVSTD